MIKIENYPNACKEVYVILNYINKEDLKKIPQSFIDMIQRKMNKDYKFKLDTSIDFEEQNLLKETKVILGYIFLNYWGTKKQKETIEKKFRNDIAKKEEQKIKYNRNELFQNNNFIRLSQNVNQNEDVKMIEYKKNILKQFIYKLKNLLRHMKKK